MTLILLLFVALYISATMGNPGAAIVDGLVLGRQIMAFVSSVNVGATALRQGSRTGRKLRGHSGIGSNPVGEGILAVLDNGLASLVTVVGSASLAGSDRSVIDELEEVLAITGDNGNLLAVLPQSIELVSVGSLNLFASNVGELSLGNKRLGLGADKLLLKDDDLGRVGFFVLELSNLVGNLLLAFYVLLVPGPSNRAQLYLSLTVSAWLDGSFNVADALDGNTVLVVAVDVLVLELADFVEQNAELVGHIGYILVASFTPDRELLLSKYVSDKAIVKRSYWGPQVDIRQLPCAPWQLSPCCA